MCETAFFKSSAVNISLPEFSDLIGRKSLIHYYDNFFGTSADCHLNDNIIEFTLILILAASSPHLK